MRINNWTKCIQDWLKWKKVVEKAKAFKHWSCSAWWEAECSFKMSAATHSKTLHHFPENHKPNYTILKTSKSLSTHNLWLAEMRAPDNHWTHHVGAYFGSFTKYKLALTIFCETLPRLILSTFLFLRDQVLRRCIQQTMAVSSTFIITVTTPD